MDERSFENSSSFHHREEKWRISFEDSLRNFEKIIQIVEEAIMKILEYFSGTSILQILVSIFINIIDI